MLGSQNNNKEKGESKQAKKEAALGMGNKQKKNLRMELTEKKNVQNMTSKWLV